MKQELNNCITGEEKPEVIQTKEGGLMYLESGRRKGKTANMMKFAEHVKELGKAISIVNSTSLSMKELAKKQKK